MGKYRNKFRIGDDVVCDFKYNWIRKGTTYRVKAVNATGSIQLVGTSGNYNPDKFYLAQQKRELGPVQVGKFRVGDRVTWGIGASSYVIESFSSDLKNAIFVAGSGILEKSGEYYSHGDNDRPVLRILRHVERNKLPPSQIDVLEEAAQEQPDVEDSSLYIAIDCGYKDADAFLKKYGNGEIDSLTSQFVIGKKDQLESLIRKGLEYGDADTVDYTENWIVAKLDSSITIEAKRTFNITSTTKEL